MRFLPIIQVDINDTVSELLTTAYDRSKTLKHDKIEAIVKGTYTAIIQIKNETCYCIIYSGLSGFAAHPRSGNTIEVFSVGSIYSPELRRGVSSGGWDETKEYAEQAPIFYPIADNVTGDALYQTTQKTTIGSGVYKLLKYGNIYWIGSTGKILSWKGTPNRHFKVDYHINIPDLSSVDDYTTENFEAVPQYTCFGNSVYSGGSVIATSPVFPWQNSGESLDSFNSGWILGAAYRNNKLVIIVYENRRFAKQFEYQVLYNDSVVRLVYGDSSDEARLSLDTDESLGEYTTLAGGFPIVVYQRGGLVDGWTRLAEFSKPRAGLPWFFSADGNAATCSNGSIISLTDTTATFSDPIAHNGTRVHFFKTGEFNNPTLDSTYTWNYHGPIFSEALGEVVATLESSSITESHRDYIETKASADRVRVGGTIDRELGIMMGTHTLGIAPFAESAQVMPLVCKWTWTTPLLNTSPYGDQSDPCNQNDSVEYTTWGGCGEYEWTAESNTGLVARASGSHYRFATISTTVAKTLTGGDCNCQNVAVAYSERTSSGRTIYTYTTITLASGSFINEADLMPGGAYRPIPIYQENTVNQDCYGVTGSCTRWQHTYHSVENSPEGKPYITDARIVSGGRISQVSVTAASIASGGTCGYDGGPSCESLNIIDGYTSYDTSGNKYVQFYDICTFNQNDCGPDAKTPRCYPEGKHFCPNGSYSLSIVDQCIYLGTLPATVFDADGNELSLPELGSNQTRLVCKIETQVCDPNGELGG